MLLSAYFTPALAPLPPFPSFHFLVHLQHVLPICLPYSECGPTFEMWSAFLKALQGKPKQRPTRRCTDCEVIPADTVFHVAKYMTVFTQVLNCALVCKGWYTAVEPILEGAAQVLALVNEGCCDDTVIWEKRFQLPGEIGWRCAVALVRVHNVCNGWMGGWMADAHSAARGLSGALQAPNQWTFAPPPHTPDGHRGTKTYFL